MHQKEILAFHKPAKVSDLQVVLLMVLRVKEKNTYFYLWCLQCICITPLKYFIFPVKLYQCISSVLININICSIENQKL